MLELSKRHWEKVFSSIGIHIVIRAYEMFGLLLNFGILCSI